MKRNELLSGEKLGITFNTSTDEDARKNNEAVQRTVTIDFSNCTLEDVLVFAAETIKIRQIQTRIRSGKAVGATFVASRPSRAGVAVADPMKLAASMTPEQKVELLALLQAQMAPAVEADVEAEAETQE